MEVLPTQKWKFRFCGTFADLLLYVHIELVSFDCIVLPHCGTGHHSYEESAVILQSSEAVPILRT